MTTEPQAIETVAVPEKKKPGPKPGFKRKWSAPNGVRQEEVLDPRIEALLKQTEELIKQNEGLTARLEAAEKQAPPKFVPMKQDSTPNVAGTYDPPEKIKAKVMKGLTRTGEAVSGRVGLFSSPEFLKKIPPQNRPIFKSGDAVRINPEATVWRGDKTWGEVLEAKHIAGVGEILSIQYMTKTWEPKYTVHVPGLTRKDGDGFRESELLPA